MTKAKAKVTEVVHIHTVNKQIKSDEKMAQEMQRQFNAQPVPAPAPVAPVDVFVLQAPGGYVTRWRLVDGTMDYKPNGYGPVQVVDVQGNHVVIQSVGSNNKYTVATVNLVAAKSVRCFNCSQAACLPRGPSPCPACGTLLAV